MAVRRVDLEYYDRIFGPDEYKAFVRHVERERHLHPVPVVNRYRTRQQRRRQEFIQRAWVIGSLLLIALLCIIGQRFM